MQKVADISITDENALWRLYIPIATGSLELALQKGQIPELDRFLDTAIKTPLRRFGENPQS